MWKRPPTTKLLRESSSKDGHDNPKNREWTFLYFGALINIFCKIEL